METYMKKMIASLLGLLAISALALSPVPVFAVSSPASIGDVPGYDTAAQRACINIGNAVQRLSYIPCNIPSSQAIVWSVPLLLDGAPGSMKTVSVTVGSSSGNAISCYLGTTGLGYSGEYLIGSTNSSTATFTTSVQLNPGEVHSVACYMLPDTTMYFVQY
jgi:hypothetical protein